MAAIPRLSASMAETERPGGMSRPRFCISAGINRAAGPLGALEQAERKRKKSKPLIHADFGAAGDKYLASFIFGMSCEEIFGYRGGSR